MSYTTLLSSEGILSQYLAVLKPRYLLSTFTLISGTKYSKVFSLGQIIKITSDGVLKTEATSSTLSDGHWYYDTNTSTLYLDIGVAPSTKVIVCTYEIYLGTFDAHWYRVPNDDTTREVYFEPLIKKSPSISLTVNDSLFGFMPSQSSTLLVSNATHLLQEHMYSSSFNNCDIDLWHYLDELNTDNFSLVFKGLCGNVLCNDTDISISVIDRNQIFKNEYRHAVGSSYYSSSEFSGCDPQYLNRPIKKVFGYSEKMIPVNIDFNSSSPTTSNNRIWVVTNDETNLGSVAPTVPVSPVSTTTRTYVSSVNGLRVGDTCWIDSASGPAFDEYITITAVGANYIDHAVITNAAASTSVVKRNFVGNVKIFKNGTLYDLKYGVHYTEYTNATYRVAGFQLVNNFEALVGMPSALTTNDLVYCRAYGHKVTSTISASPFGSNSSVTGGLTNGIVILYDILKTYLGLSESEINTSQFTTLEASITDSLGFTLPYSKQNDFPTYADIITKISQTLLLKVFQNSSNKWSISQIAPIGTTTKTIEDDEILIGSFSHNFDYSDVISHVIVNYLKSEVTNRNEFSDDSFSRVTTTSNNALYLHLIKKQKTFESFHFIESEAQVLSDRLSYIFGERQGLLTLSTKNRFFNSIIGDEVTVSRTRQFGYEYDTEVLRNLDLSIVSIDKSLSNITIELNDFKGITDNEGTW